MPAAASSWKHAVDAEDSGASRRATRTHRPTREESSVGGGGGAVAHRLGTVLRAITEFLAADSTANENDTRFKTVVSGAPKWRRSCRMCAPSSTYCIVGPSGSVMNKCIPRRTIHISCHFHWSLQRSADSTANQNYVIYVSSYICRPKS